MISRRGLLSWLLPNTGSGDPPSDPPIAPIAPPSELPSDRISLTAKPRPPRPSPNTPPGPMIATIQHFSCLNSRADFCATCAERCPRRAIRIDGRRAVVDAAGCDGCGGCLPRCPAPGGGAILLRPRLPSDGPAPLPMGEEANRGAA